MRIIATLTGEGFPVDIVLHHDGHLSFIADADIDVDGSGPSHGDPCYQPETTLHHEGKPLNSDVDKYIVVPPVLVKGVVPVVMGSLAHVTNLNNARTSCAVVGDVGPSRKTGEISRALAIELGIDPDPQTGGMDTPNVLYKVFPGTAACVDGKQYHLQPS
jgi:hypothetical protein